VTTTDPHDEQPQRTINVELLDRIEQQITEHPDTWDQSVWFRLPRVSSQSKIVKPPCGTACCVAGWAVVLSGYQLVTRVRDREGAFCVSPEGEGRGIEAAARGILGLDVYQAEALFDATNDLDTVREIFAELRKAAR
jgi:hypothetical protein